MEYKKQLFVDIGKRLKICRNELNLTQEEFAEILGISLTYYGQIERGMNGPSLEKILLYLKLNIDPTYLITGKVFYNLDVDVLLENCQSDKKHAFEQLIKNAINLLK
ncbi:TPA: helix-turn-helix transcriptional regulator [Clostridioides difficile]|nr:helix-turn-helix transcriptional regulator [Clostridioides difficile]